MAAVFFNETLYNCEEFKRSPKNQEKFFYGGWGGMYTWYTYKKSIFWKLCPACVYWKGKTYYAISKMPFIVKLFCYIF